MTDEVTADAERLAAIREQVESRLDDENHEALCACGEWPARCATYGSARPWSHSAERAIELTYEAVATGCDAEKERADQAESALLEVEDRLRAPGYGTSDLNRIALLHIESWRSGTARVCPSPEAEPDAAKERADDVRAALIAAGLAGTCSVADLIRHHRGSASAALGFDVVRAEAERDAEMERAEKACEYGSSSETLQLIAEVRQLTEERNQLASVIEVIRGACHEDVFNPGQPVYFNAALIGNALSRIPADLLAERDRTQRAPAIRTIANEYAEVSHTRAFLLGRADQEESPNG